MEEESRYHLFDPDVSTYPELSSVYRYWQDKRGERFAPSWADINLLDIPSAIIPRICVVNVSADKGDFTYRFWGTTITDMHHYDLSGKSVHHLKPARYAKNIFRQYQTVLDIKRSQGFLTEMPLESGMFTYYATIRMPLSSDGENINMIMCAEDYGESRDQLRKVFEEVVHNPSV